MAPRTGLEPVTYGLEGRCSIQLSYRGLYTFLIQFIPHANTLPDSVLTLTVSSWYAITSHGPFIFAPLGATRKTNLLFIIRCLYDNRDYRKSQEKNDTCNPKCSIYRDVLNKFNHIYILTPMMATKHIHHRQTMLST